MQNLQPTSSSKIFGGQQAWYQRLDSTLKNKLIAIQKNLVSVQETALKSDQPARNTNSFSSSFFSSSIGLRDGPVPIQSQRKLILDLIMDFDSFLTKAEKENKNTIANQEILDLQKVTANLKAMMSEKDSGEWAFVVVTFAKIIEETLVLVEMRKMIISSYYDFVSPKGLPNYEECNVDIAYIQKKLNSAFQNPLMISLASNFNCELKVFSEICSMLTSLSKFDFAESVMSLFQIKNCLAEWKHLMQKEQHQNPKDPSSKYLYVGWTFGWLNKIYQTLMAKFSLYFSCALKNHDDPKAMAYILEKADSHYHFTIHEFCSKTSAYNLSLILDTSELPLFDEKGYKLPSEDTQVTGPQRSGLLSWIPVFSFPKPEAPKEHWPNIITLCYQREDFLAKSNRNVLSFYDKKVQFTYFIVQVEPKVVLALLYKGQKDSPQIREFLRDAVQFLTLEKVFSHLTNK